MQPQNGHAFLNKLFISYFPFYILNLHEHLLFWNISILDTGKRDETKVKFSVLENAMFP